MNTEKIVEELERENAFLRYEMWMDGEKMDDLGMQQTKGHDDKRRVARCSGCRFLSPQEYQPYQRLWPFLACKACGDKILDLAACPQGTGRRER